jgi:hypothetical protein
VVEIGLEVRRDGEERSEAADRGDEVSVERGREHLPALQLRVRVDEHHRAVRGGVVVVERQPVEPPHRVMGDERRQDLDEPPW